MTLEMKVWVLVMVAIQQAKSGIPGYGMNKDESGVPGYGVNEDESGGSGYGDPRAESEVLVTEALDLPESGGPEYGFPRARIGGLWLC